MIEWFVKYVASWLGLFGVMMLMIIVMYAFTLLGSIWETIYDKVKHRGY
jgi:hypothetical protein